METYNEACIEAAKLTSETACKHIPFDKGDGVSPRFGVMVIPQVGDKVSYYFNGDSYPDGEIVFVSSDLKKITTTTGNIYKRKGLSATWKLGKTWSMIKGHEKHFNREF